MRSRSRAGVAVLLISATVALTGCGQSETHHTEKSPDSKSDPSAEETNVADPIVVTHRGGLSVIDADTFEVAETVGLEGFIRVNPAGDDRHVLVSTVDGFQVLDAVAGELTDHTFSAEAAGHVVRHGGSTTLFADGTGEITNFDPTELGTDRLPDTKTHITKAPHHGVAVHLPNGELITSDGTEHETNGAVALAENGEEIARSDDCPGLHGEATAPNDTVVIGCENGALVYADGTFTKIDSPTEYGRIGNQSGSEHSPIVLGDYKKDADAELERPRQVALVDTENHRIRLVDLPATYSFRSLGRGPEGDALVLGSDGKIHVIDPETAKITDAIDVLESEWKEPTDWQQPRPTLFVREDTAYVSDPSRRELHAVDLTSGKVTDTLQLDEEPNEVSGVIAG